MMIPTTRAMVTTLTTALLACASPLHVAAQQAPQAEAAYDRVAKAWAALSTLEARFDQRITNPIIGRTVTSRGLYRQAKPGRIAIDFVEPKGDRIVGDGTSLWVYLPSSAPGQVLKLPASADGAIVADLLGQLLDTPRRSFTITGGEAQTIDGRSTTRVQLVPRQADAVPFARAVLWLDTQEPRPVRVQVIDGQGVDRTITLTSWSPGAPLAKEVFRFDVPKGVKVQTKLPGS